MESETPTIDGGPKSEPKMGTPELTIVVRCIDCRVIIATQRGRTTKLGVQWNICQACVARRNGLVGARSFKELGIY